MQPVRRVDQRRNPRPPMHRIGRGRPEIQQLFGLPVPHDLVDPLDQPVGAAMRQFRTFRRRLQVGQTRVQLVALRGDLGGFLATLGGGAKRIELPLNGRDGAGIDVLRGLKPFAPPRQFLAQILQRRDRGLRLFDRLLGPYRRFFPGVVIQRGVFGWPRNLRLLLRKGALHPCAAQQRSQRNDGKCSQTPAQQACHSANTPGMLRGA